ncbi:hypothetical protein Q8F55_006358 [Vanrija albida]|uniref:Uncharacterized protein n=1 Tax=Vanrija albida TaxID=181172 RepID=A0ABR3PWY3_9TREE
MSNPIDLSTTLLPSGLTDTTNEPNEAFKVVLHLVQAKVNAFLASERRDILLGMDLDEVCVVLSHRIACCAVGYRAEFDKLCVICICLGPKRLREAVAALAKTELVQPTPTLMRLLTMLM